MCSPELTLTLKLARSMKRSVTRAAGRREESVFQNSRGGDYTIESLYHGWLLLQLLLHGSGVLCRGGHSENLVGGTITRTQNVLALGRQAGGGALFVDLDLLQTLNELHILGQHELGLQPRVDEPQHVLH